MSDEDKHQGVESEIADMIASLGGSGESPTSKAPSSESPSTNAPATESPATGSPATEAPSTESPSTSAPATEPPEVDEKDKIIEDLRAKLADKDKPREPEKEPEPEPVKFEDQDFVGEEEFDDLINSKDGLNKLLNKVHQKAVIDTSERLTRNLPESIRDTVVLIDNLRKSSEKFYEDNSDLKPFKKVVGTVFEELVTENPDMTHDEVYTKVAEETRKRLDLSKPTNKPKETKTERKSPKLPKTGSKAGRLDTTDNKPSGMESEIDAMNKVLLGR